MATDATGAPTPLGIPKYNPNVDAPSGLGFNAAMDTIDTLIAGRAAKPAGIVSGEVPVWDGTNWVRSSTLPLGTNQIADGAITGEKQGSQVWARLSRAGTAQSIPNGVETLVNFDLEPNDPDNMWVSGTPERLTVPRQGVWLFTTFTTWGISTVGERITVFRTNGNEYLRSSIGPNAGGASNYTQAVLIPLNSGDYITLGAYQNSGAALTVIAHLSALYLGSQL